MAPKKKIINITSQNAGQGIKELYDAEATARARNPRPFISRVITFACSDNNKMRFKSKLENSAQKGGSHISVEVSEDIKEKLKKWADEQESTQALLANHILEKVVEMNMFDEIFD